MASGMDSASWDRRYAGRDLRLDSQPNRFLVAETEALAPGRADRPRLWRGTQRGSGSPSAARRAVGADFSEVGLQKEEGPRARQPARRERGVGQLHGGDLNSAQIARPSRTTASLTSCSSLCARSPGSSQQSGGRSLLRAAAEAVAPGGTFLRRRARQQQPPARTPAARRDPARALHRERRRYRSSRGAGLCGSSVPSAWSARYTRRTESGSHSTRSCAPAAPGDRRRAAGMTDTADRSAACRRRRRPTTIA